jgi:hypothetical protein
VHLSWQALQDLEHCSEFQPLTQVIAIQSNAVMLPEGILNMLKS